MTEIAQTTETVSTTPTRPQPDMGDLEAVKAALLDPDFIWEI